MKLARAYAAGVGAIVKRDATIYATYRARFLTQVVAAFLSLTLFYYVSRLVTVGTFDSPDAYFAFAVVGLVIFQVLGGTLAVLPTSVRQELVAGTFEKFVVSPFGPVAAIASLTIFPFVVAFLQGIIMLALAAAVFGMHLEWSTVPLALPVAILGALAFVPFALLLAAAVLAIKQAGAGAGFLVTGISLIGGFLFPVALLPDWIEWLSKVQPFTPTVELLRELLVGIPIETSWWVAVAKIVGFSVVLMPLGLASVAAAIRFAQKRGTIIEY
jgi:ABC-2 type transport system permease protein